MTYYDDNQWWDDTINLNDPHCRQFIEAVASILVHLAQQEPESEEERIAAYLASLFAPLPDRDGRDRPVDALESTRYNE